MTEHPPEPDWKDYVPMGGRDWSHAILETTCPNCHLGVGALIRDDDDPWKNVDCPICGHEWTERTA